GPGEDVLSGVRLRLLLTQLLRPGHALRHISTRAGTAVFGVARRLLSPRLLPVHPALRTDLLAHLAVDERRRRVRAPGPAEVDRRLLHRRVGGQLAVQEDVAEGLVLRGRSGGEIAASFAVDLAVVEDGG